MREWVWAMVLAAGMAGCGNEAEPQRRRPAHPPAGATQNDNLLAPGPVSGPTAVTGPAGAPGGVTGAVALVGPALPGQRSLVRLQARINVNGASLVTTVTSTHPGEPLAAVPVAPGRVTLTFLDETGAATALQTAADVAAGQTVQVPVGSVQVSLDSVAHADRQGSRSLVYRIGQGSRTLKRVRADVGTAVDLPPGTYTWTGIGESGGELPGIDIPVHDTLTTRAWGSVFVRKSAGDTVTIRTAGGVVVFPQTADGVEYLLPATDQTHGCMVYLGVVNLLATNTITLCQDAILHVDLFTR